MLIGCIDQRLSGVIFITFFDICYLVLVGTSEVALDSYVLIHKRELNQCIARKFEFRQLLKVSGLLFVRI